VWGLLYPKIMEGLEKRLKSSSIKLVDWWGKDKRRGDGLLDSGNNGGAGNRGGGIVWAAQRLKGLMQVMVGFAALLLASATGLGFHQFRFYGRLTVNRTQLDSNSTETQVFPRVGLPITDY
jgi:hypothetical protein